MKWFSPIMLVIALAGQSQAAFTLNITQTSGPSAGATTGNLSFSPTSLFFIGPVGLGDFIVENTTANSNSTLAALSQAATLFGTNTSVRNTANATATLRIDFFDDTFNFAHSPNMQLTTRLAGDFLSQQGNITAQAFVNGVGGNLLSITQVGGDGDVDPLTSVQNIANGSNPFTLRVTWFVTLRAGDAYNGSASARLAEAVPAPTGLIAVASGLPFIALQWWRIRRNAHAPALSA